MSIALVVIFLVSTIAFCSKPNKPTEEDIAAMVDSLVAFELEKIKSVEPAAPKIDSVAFAKAVADSVAVAVAKKESVFLDMLKEYVTKSTLNIKKRPKAPKRQGCMPYDARYYSDTFSGNSECYAAFPLYGPVKSMGIDDEYSDECVFFDKHGNVSSESLLTGDSTDPQSADYKYDAKNRLIRIDYILSRTPDLGGVVSAPRIVATKFNSRGDITEYDEYTGGVCWNQKSGTKQIKYDSRGNLVEFDGETRKYDSKNNLVELSRNDCTMRFYYSRNGILVLSEAYNGENSLIEVCLFLYDKQGNMVENRQFSPDGKLQCKYLYKYDRMGNVIECNMSSSNGYESSVKYKITYYK